MRIVVGAVVERPLAHSGSHAVGDFERQRRPPLHRIEQLGINRLVEIPAHGLAAEYLVPKYSEGLPSGAFTSTAL